MNFKKIFFKQESSMDCGLACLKMICRYYGKEINIERIRGLVDFDIQGISLNGIFNAAKSLELSPIPTQLSLDEILIYLSEGPIITHWKGNHFVVVFYASKKSLIIGDPEYGIKKISHAEFKKNTHKKESNKAYVILFQPTDAFKIIEEDKPNKLNSLKYIISIFRKNLYYVITIFLGMLVILFLQFTQPFFSKLVVDLGISSKSIDYLKYLLIGQLIIIFSSTCISILKSWLSLLFSNKVNYSLISEFIKKLISLPITFFETRKTGEILQRVIDHNRVESFITRTSFNMIFSVGSIIVYSSILAYYNAMFFLLFLLSTLIYLSWTGFFLKRRKYIDYERFHISSEVQNNMLHIINGIRDIKISNTEAEFFESWSKKQKDLIKNNFSSFKLNQIQETGANMIFQVFNILMTFISASLVIKGQITLGEMISIQFIIGQVSAPIFQFVNGILIAQDAKISFNRLNQIISLKHETEFAINKDRKISEKIYASSLRFENVSFSYIRNSTKFSIKNLSLSIPKGKITAIVGVSGSGKTTILKLLLGYYDNYEGKISVENRNLKEINIRSLRNSCGVVLQESYIFNTSIEENIALTKEIDYKLLKMAIDLSCLNEFVNDLPGGLQTKIGNEGKGLSQGQRQRILIARAIYKQPNFVLFDEATNSLDAETESNIVSNLKDFFVNRTTIIIAHRFSTIQYCDNIIVMRDGTVVEQGTPRELMEKKNEYYNLIQKQLM